MKFKSRLFVFSLILCILLSIAAVSAEDIQAAGEFAEGHDSGAADYSISLQSTDNENNI